MRPHDSVRWSVFVFGLFAIDALALLPDRAPAPTPQGITDDRATAQAPADDKPTLDRSPEARRERLRRFGGTANTENAVEAGLIWLAAHQSPDGSWDRFNFDHYCPSGDSCLGPALDRKTESLQSGINGLALLAFLGAGYTDREGVHAETVKKAALCLLEAQRPDGGFSATPGMAGYNDSLATFALAEYYALTHDRRLVTALRRAVRHIAESQQPLGGWDYVADPQIGRDDTSITGWMVQALQACAAAGIEVPRASMIQALLHFSRAAQPDGRVWYADGGTGFDMDRDGKPQYRFGSAMTAVGLTAERLLGWRGDGALVGKQESVLLADHPSATLARGGDKTELHSEYYWYYGTVAMFQSGGTRWERWNAQLRDACLPLQDRTKYKDGRKHHSFGSWPPYGNGWGKWGRMGGRVYTTAISVLTLEIYYRYTPAYLEEHLALSADDWRAFLRDADHKQRRQAVLALREGRLEMAEPALIDVLTDEEPRIAVMAAEALASLDSPQGKAVVERALPGLPAWEKSAAEAALRQIKQIEALAPVEGRVRLYDAERKLATLDLPRSYVGLKIAAYRGGQESARLRVIQRFSGRTVALAEVLQERMSPPPQAGERVGMCND